MSLEQAIAFMTNAPVLLLDMRVAHKCLTMQVQEELEAGHNPVGTWKPKGSFFFTLMKMPNGLYVYSHDTERLYIASNNMRIAHSCPDNVAFLGHFFLENGVPRFLVFDLVEYNFDSVEARYNRLRDLARFLPQPVCMLQWVGDLGSLRQEFLVTLPHQVDYLFSMVCSNPCIVHKITLPQP